jgi:hypothetical protein
MLAAFTSSADDLEALKAAATRYVASMKAVLAFPERADCSETIAEAGEYAAAKIAYYNAARQAILDDKLDRCRSSGQQDQVRVAVERARQIAEQFIEDVGRLEGT